MDEARVMDGLDPYDWAAMLPNYDKIADGSFRGTNWLDESRNRNAPMQNYNLNVSGGSDVSVYSLGLGYTSQEGTLGYPSPPKFSRYTARFNSEYVLVRGNSFDIVRLGENLTYAYTYTPVGMNMGDMYSNDIRSLMRTHPLMPVRDDSGAYSYAMNWENRHMNPIARRAVSKDTSISKEHSLRTSLYLIVEPIKDLTLRSNFGYSFGNWSGRTYSPVFDLGPAPGSFNETPRVSQSMGSGQDITVENTVTYSFGIGADHRFTALVGQSIEKGGGAMGDQLTISNTDPQFTGLEHAYINNAPLVNSGETAIGGQPYGMYRLASFFGRLSWDYRGRYMATAVLRADGSSNFARGHRWGYFPSVSAGWVISDERFMEGTRRWMNFFKLRASWGQNGNQAIDNFQYLSPITTGGRYTFGNDKQNSSIAAYPSILANPDVSWETSEQIDIGFDANFFRSRLSVAFDYYVKNTKNWLLVAPMLASYGTGAPYVNGGDIRNSGFEIALDWNDNVRELQYGANLNLAFNRNRITRIANSEGIIHGDIDFMFQPHSEAFRAQVGYPIGYFYGYKTAGIFQSYDHIDSYTGARLDNARPGDVIWVDSDGDGVITELDRGMIGDPTPDLTMGIGLNFEWRGFDLGITMHGVFGNQIMRSWRSWPDMPKDNYTAEIFGRWHGEGTSNRLPRLTTSSHPNHQWVSDLYIENGDYLRMQNITLGYDFRRLSGGNFLSQLRLYVSAQNLFTITRYSGMDPEVGWGNRGWVSGIDLGFYPAPRTYQIGVNVKF
jgi:TonB-linked SusC/RagA family outer membrane protein